MKIHIIFSREGVATSKNRKANTYPISRKVGRVSGDFCDSNRIPE